MEGQQIPAPIPRSRGKKPSESRSRCDLRAYQMQVHREPSRTPDTFMGTPQAFPGLAHEDGQQDDFTVPHQSGLHDHSTASGKQRSINAFLWYSEKPTRHIKYLELVLGPLSVPSPQTGFGGCLMLPAGMWLCFCCPFWVYIMGCMQTCRHADWLNCTSSSQTPAYTSTKLQKYKQVHFVRTMVYSLY